MKKILFVSPYSGRAGAEMYLYRFLQHYEAGSFEAMVATEKRAPLFGSLEPKVKTVSLADRSRFFPVTKAVSRVGGVIRRQAKSSTFEIFLEHLHRSFEADRWVLNTIVMHKVMPIALRLGVKVSVLVHEMPSAYSFVPHDGLERLMQADQVISVSSAACRAIARMGRPDVLLHPGGVDLDAISMRRSKAEMRGMLGVAEHEFVVVGAGSLDFNKGIELFVAISERCAERNWRFVWLGGERKTGFNYYLSRYASSVGRVSFVGERDADYYDYMAIADTFVLPSFNESFSLASLEALALGVPVVAYDCGGVADFVDDSCGCILQTRTLEDWIAVLDAIAGRRRTFDPVMMKSKAARYSVQMQAPGLVKSLMTGL